MRSSRSTTTFVVLAATGVAACLLFGAAAPAAAAEPGEILVSADGVTFAKTLDHGLFDRFGLLIPGGSVDSTVWIKNGGDSAAELRVSARDVEHSSASFAIALTLSTEDSRIGREPGEVRSRELGSFADCDVLLPTTTLAAGEVTMLTLNFELADLDGQTAQGDTARLDLLVSMRDAAAGPFPDSACEDTGTVLAATGGGSSGLASTGPSAVAILLMGAGFLLALGAGVLTLVGWRRRSGLRG